MLFKKKKKLKIKRQFLYYTFLKVIIGSQNFENADMEIIVNI